MSAPPMLAPEFSAALEAIGWGPTVFAHHARMSDRHVRRMLAGQYPVPPALAAWLRNLVAWLQANPCP